MTTKTPKHVAIIMDGNGRWAHKRKLPRVMGHRAGAKAVRRAIEFCVRNKIDCLTLFALGIENRQNRPKKEVNFLLSLFLDSLRQHTEELHKNNICIKIIGDRQHLGETLLCQVNDAENLTAANSGLTLMIAVDYSGRWDILQASQKALADGLVPSELTADRFKSYLSFSEVPEPDLLIRTSGEQRISNFMLWQLAYTELYFSDVYWPDFDEPAFQQALDAFQLRKRRFGYIDESFKEKIHA